MTKAHDQRNTHRYTVHFPDHAPREDDPHYVDFQHIHKTQGPSARCAMAMHFDDGLDPVRQTNPPHRLIGLGELKAGCDVAHPMELHHAHVEFALQQSVDLAALEKDYPGISNKEEVGAWVESSANLEWLCMFHHRGHGGVHNASYSDFEAQKYVRNLIS